MHGADSTRGPTCEPVGRRLPLRSRGRELGAVALILGAWALAGLGRAGAQRSAGSDGAVLDDPLAALMAGVSDPLLRPAPALAGEEPGGRLVVSEDVPERAEALPQAPTETRWFDGRPVRPVREILMTVTAYSPDARSCGRSADGITASGYSVWTNGMKLVAADTRVLSFASLVSVPGYDRGNVVPVLDRGAKIKGNKLDVLFPTHEEARRWGVRKLPVTVWEYADGGGRGLKRRRG